MEENPEYELAPDRVLLKKHFPELDLLVEIPKCSNKSENLNIILAMILQRASLACINEYLSKHIKLGLKESSLYGGRLPLPISIPEELYEKILAIAIEKNCSLESLCEDWLWQL